MPDTPANSDPTPEDLSGFQPRDHGDPRRARRQRHVARAGAVGVSSAFVTPSVDEGRRMATTSRAQRFYSRYGNPTVCRVRGRDRRARGRRSGTRVRLGHGRGERSRVGAVLDRRSHRHPEAAVRRHAAGLQRDVPAVRHRRDVRRRPPIPMRGTRRSVPARRCCASRRRPANPRLALVDLGAAGCHRGAGHRGRLDVRHAARPAAARRTGSTWCCTRPPRRSAGHNDASLGVVAGSAS